MKTTETKLGQVGDIVDKLEPRFNEKLRKKGVYSKAYSNYLAPNFKSVVYALLRDARFLSYYDHYIAARGKPYFLYLVKDGHGQNPRLWYYASKKKEVTSIIKDLLVDYLKW